MRDAPNSPTFTAKQAAAVTGVPQHNQRAWRRLGHFPVTKPPDAWTRYSFADLVAFAVMKRIVDRGMLLAEAAAGAATLRSALPCDHAGPYPVLVAEVGKGAIVWATYTPDQLRAKVGGTLPLDLYAFNVGALVAPLRTALDKLAS